MHGRGACVVGVHGRGACVAGEMATAAGGTHPTGMYSCIKLFPVISLGIFQAEKPMKGMNKRYIFK